MSRLREERATRSSRSRGGVAARSTLLLMWDSRRRAAASPRKPARPSALPDRQMDALYLFASTGRMTHACRTGGGADPGCTLAQVSSGDPRTEGGGVELVERPRIG